MTQVIKTAMLTMSRKLMRSKNRLNLQMLRSNSISLNTRPMNNDSMLRRIPHQLLDPKTKLMNNDLNGNAVKDMNGCSAAASDARGSGIHLSIATLLRKRVSVNRLRREIIEVRPSPRNEKGRKTFCSNE